MPQGDKLGAVFYNEGATEEMALSFIKDEKDRDVAILRVLPKPDDISNDADGIVCIGCGINQAIDVSFVFFIRPKESFLAIILNQSRNMTASKLVNILFQNVSLYT